MTTIQMYFSLYYNFQGKNKAQGEEESLNVQLWNIKKKEIYIKGAPKYLADGKKWLTNK